MDRDDIGVSEDILTRVDFLYRPRDVPCRIISGKGKVAFGKKKVDFGGRGAVQVWPLFVGGVIAVVGGILGIVASQLVVYASGALLMVWAAAAVAYVLKMM